MSQRHKPDKCRVHLTMVIGEVIDGDYSRCDRCGGKTMLIIAPSFWSVASEPFKSGESAKKVFDDVVIPDEITAHYCDNCDRITSLSFNEGGK